MVKLYQRTITVYEFGQWDYNAAIGKSSPVKELYFTPETIYARAAAMQQDVEQYRGKRSLSLQPQRAALLMLDLQAYFFDPASHAYIPSAPAILPGVTALARAFAARGRPVIYTRHLNTPQDAGQMAHWWRDLIRPADPLSALLPELEMEQGVILTKSQYDAFHGTDLEERLRQSGVSQVVVCGVMTHLCCETTARSAFMRGFEVFFVIDGTATYNEALHRAALLTLAHGFSSTALMKEISIQLSQNEHTNR
jgi:isochorismate hydrolase